MKNLFTLIIITVFTTGAVFSQDAFKDLKNAEKALKKYTANQDKVEELEKGMKLMDSAFNSDEVKASAKAWITRGKVLKGIANAEFVANQIDASKNMENPMAAAKAYDAYTMAKGLTERKNELKEIQTGISELEGHLNNFAVVSYGKKDYAGAFQNFSRSLEAYDVLKGMGAKSRLDEVDGMLNDQKLYTAISAYYDEDLRAQSMPYLKDLYEANSEEAFVYEALYNLTAESDQEKAVAYLAKGREMNPDDTALLFAEINHYLKIGETDKLIANLEVALEKEPDNASIYNTIASVYDQLQQSETDPVKSQAHFDKALGYYNDVLAMEGENFDAQYSIGALYYNKAAKYVDKLNTLAGDLTPAGMKKYDEAKVEMDGLFKQALPYFLEAEKLKADDGNTIIALKEIYARMNDLEKSNEYKTKMDGLK